MKATFASTAFACLSLAGLVAQSSASVLERATCNHDLCLRALLGRGAAAGPDCASDLATTIVCTTTGTSTVTIPTQSTVTVTDTVTVDNAVPTSTLVVTSSFFETTVITTTVNPPDFTITSTSHLAWPPANTAGQKRDGIEARIVDTAEPGNIAVRAIATSCSTILPSKVPAYASPCSGIVRYSSACACISAAQSTVTSQVGGSPVTVTVTTVLPPSTIHSTTTATSAIITVTSTASITSTITDEATVTIGTASTTVSWLYNGCSTFTAQALGGDDDGDWLNSYLGWFQGQEYAATFKINPDHTITSTDGIIVWETFSINSQYYNQGSIVYQKGINFEYDPTYGPLDCDVVFPDGITPTPHSPAFLTCNDGVGATQWKACDEGGALGLRTGSYDCPQFQILLYPAC